MSAITKFNLSERQAEFVRLTVGGMAAIPAAKLAGYSETSAYQLKHNANVQAAVFAGIQKELQSDAPVSLRVLRELRDDKATPARVRADIGVKLLQLSGHTVPEKTNGAPQKALSDMTRDEMIAFIEQNQAAIDRAEQELMNRAKDVSPAGNVTDSVPVESVDDAKPLNYLD